MKLSRQFINPAADFLSEFDDLFNRAFSRSLVPGSRKCSGTFGVYEAENAWHLRTDLPGFRKKDISLRLEDGVLHLAAEREDQSTFHSRLERTFRLPDNINLAEIAARLENGVLEISLPKVEVEQPKTLHIEVK